jgi:hypothetical protein
VPVKDSLKIVAADEAPPNNRDAPTAASRSPDNRLPNRMIFPFHHGLAPRQDNRHSKTHGRVAGFPRALKGLLTSFSPNPADDKRNLLRICAI